MSYPYGGEVDALIDAAKSAIKTGNKEAAREYLDQVVENSEYNEEAWFLLYQVVDTDEERRICLENVLELNPEHDEARAALEQLNGGVTVDPLFGDFDPFADDAGAAGAAVAGGRVGVEVQEPKKAKKTSKRGGLANNRRALVVLMILLALGTVAMVALAILLSVGAI